MSSWHLVQCHLEEVNDLPSIGQSSVTENSSLNPWVLNPTREVNFGLA